MEQTRYQYRSLQSSSHIRLLHLHPDEDLRSPDVHCEIEQVDLATDPPPLYEALSYVWGSDEKPSRISCGQKTGIPLTASLYHALRDLRRPSETRILWADAICINQDDVLERNQQVCLMDRVYSAAQQVITYIGEGTDERYMGILFAQQLCDYVAKSYPNPPDPRLREPARYTELGFPHQEDPVWGHLRAVFCLPWSSRMWIVQESMLNQNMIMVCGRLQFPWSMLGDLEVLASQDRIPRLAISEYAGPHTSSLAVVSISRGSGIGILNTLRKAAKLGYLQHETLQLLLQACHSLASTDPRDKIYALLNIAKDREKLGITLDYRLPVTKVYTDIAVRILQSDSKLDLLSSVFAEKSMLLPSWVPDWTRGGYTLLSATKSVRNGIYRASGNTNPDVKFDEQSNTISLDGVFFDRLSYVSGRIGPDKIRRNPAWIREQIKMASNLPMYVTEEKAINAFWRTLVANLAQPEHLEEPSEAPDGYRKYFDAFVKLQSLLAEAENGATVTIGQSEYDMGLAFETSVIASASTRSLCTTDRGYLGLAPEHAKVGDSVCILSGARVPYILRAEAGENKLIGEAYIQGLMKGEAMQLKDFKVERITLM
jgi:hypothetical protein